MQLLLDSQMGDIQVDSIQIEQVILNILLNGIDAMKSMPEDSRKLTIQTLVDTNKAIEVIIKDTGVGLADETAERIFDSYSLTNCSFDEKWTSIVPLMRLAFGIPLMTTLLS